MQLRLVADVEGNVSFGGEMLRTADGTKVPPAKCRECGAPLSSVNERMKVQLCDVCVEKQPSNG